MKTVSRKGTRKIRHEPKVSYLTYPDFETDPHPTLQHSLRVHLQTFHIKARNFGAYQNPPILHRKEAFLHPDHPLYNKVARLTRQEDEASLLSRPNIGTKAKWEEALQEMGVTIRNYSLHIRKENVHSDVANLRRGKHESQ